MATPIQPQVTDNDMYTKKNFRSLGGKVPCRARGYKITLGKNVPGRGKGECKDSEMAGESA